MNMHIYRVLSVLIILFLAVVLVACSQPRPGEMQGPTKSSANFCKSYEMQEIYQDDSNDEKLRKLRDNTYFQGVCL